LMGFLTSSQQIYVDHYGMGAWFPAFFAAGGAISAFGGFLNSQLVTRFGMRPLSHGALVAYAALSVIMLLFGYFDVMPVFLFFAMMAAIFVSFNFIMSNFGALAMAPLGEVAGTAASTQGFLQMVIGAALGAIIGQLYDGTPVPMAAGFVILSLLAGVIVVLGTGKNLQEQAT